MSMTLRAENEHLIQAALEYAGYGWRVLPIKPASKLPLIKQWQISASIMPAVIEQWWDQWPEANVGVLLGKGSNLIDIECDSKKAEQEYLALFDGDPPITTTYAGLRGKHRLFRYHPDLPGGAVVHIGEIEVRTGNAGKGAQSVFPPSIHPSGNAYQWLVPPSECPPADIPKQVLARLWNLRGDTPLFDETPEGRSEEEWSKIISGSSEGTRNVDMAAYCGYLLGQAKDLSGKKAFSVLFQSAEAVNARNQPPLSDKELKTIFCSILKREQTRRMNTDAETVLPQTPEKQIEAARGKASTGLFKLVIVDSDPPRYELHAPQFDQAKNECIILTAEQMVSPSAIRTQALKQAVYPLPREFDKLWSKKDGLYERLVFNAEHKDALADDKRSVVIVGLLLDQLGKARVTEEGKEPDRRGRPCLMSDGSIICKFGYVWEPMRRGEDKVERRELSMILQEVGVEYVNRRVAGKQCKLMALSPDCVKRLREIYELAE